MAGHSHAKNVMHKKERVDKKRSALFGKLLKSITVAAQTGDPNPDFNPTLRTAVDKAKAAGVPKDNIERAIKKSTDSSQKLEEITMEAYGPEGVALLIIAVTDNSNRTISEVKHLLNQLGAKWAESGSVLWAFERLPDHSWQAKFPQAVSPEVKFQIDSLIDKLSDHDDIQTIYTNATT